MVEKALKGSSDGGSQETGLDLKALRDERGLTLDDVFKATRISVLNLEAIERGEYHNLPPPVYTRNYLKAYARLLNVDESQMTGCYDKYLASLFCNDEERHGETAESSMPLFKRAILPGSLVALFCLLGLLIYQLSIFRAADDSLNPPSHQNAQEKTAVKVGDATMTAKTEGKAQIKGSEPSEEKQLQAERSKPYLANQAAPVKEDSGFASSKDLVIKAHELTWLRITDDQHQSFQVLMKPGEKIERSGRQFAIDIGNAGGVSIEFQGSVLNKIGKSGEVVHLRLPERN